MSKYICGKCNIEMTVQRPVVVLDTFCDPPLPYKAWYGGRCVCDVCGAAVVGHVGDEPFTEHYKSGFDKDFDAAFKKYEVVLNLEVKRHIGTTVFSVLKNRAALNKEK